MKKFYLLLVLAALAGCSSPSNDDAAPPTPASPVTASDAVVSPAVAPAPAAVEARGVVEAVDVAARTVTITHGPVAALKWPAMTMTFKAPTVDIGGLKQGDQVAFTFTSTGMDGTLTAITRQ
ncbi:MAG: copper-binding protein [Lysobacter sp.]